MERFDVLVIGNGSGGHIANYAAGEGYSTCLVDLPPPGGTCQNFGCIPSKMLIAPADRIHDIRDSAKLGIDAEIRDIDFDFIMDRMRKNRRESRASAHSFLSNDPPFTYIEGEARFIGESAIAVEGREIFADKIFIATGARPLIPPIDGIDEVDYLTNESVLELRSRPESIAIVGGGYIGAEYENFFSAVGTKVTVVQRGERILPREEPEISEYLAGRISARSEVLTNHGVVALENGDDGNITLCAKNRESGEEIELTAERVMIATGRKSNADRLNPEKAGIERNERGYIRVDRHLETSAEGIYAMGDAIGKGMFKHTANREAGIAWYNATHAEKTAVNYAATPHAVFSRPQIARVGSTEEEAAREHEILVGRAEYSSIAMGTAMGAGGFAKAVVDRKSRRILGFHIVGPEASTLIQEVVNAAAAHSRMDDIVLGQHIHPALPELILEVLGNLK